MSSGPPRRRRARPVSDAPLDALLDRSEDLTKGWLLALLEGAPLDDAPRILAVDLTRDGPRLCEAVVRAIGSDTDHRRLEPGGALVALAGRVGELAGAGGPQATAEAVDALQAVVWSALRTELRDPDPELVSELSERLSQVTALLRTAALGSAAQPGPRLGMPPLAAAPSPGQPPPAAVAPERRSVAPVGEPPSDVALPPVAPAVPPAEQPAAAEPRSRAWMGAPAAEPDPPALWVGALEEEIRRTGETPLSLLLAELEDADHLRAVESPADSAMTFGEFAQALRRAVRRQDILVRESEARAWIIARDTGRSGAHALSERIVAAVHAAPDWRGAPLDTSIGVAVLGEDGRTPGDLIEAAEEARFAASACGSA